MADRLRTRDTNILLNTKVPSMVWTVSDIRSGACRALLYVTPRETHKGRDSYSLENLYIQDDELLHPVGPSFTPGRVLRPIQEVLLQAVCTFADYRNADLHLHGDLSTFPAVMQCVLAMHGFLRGGAGLLVRPPWSEVVQSNEMLAVLERQMRRIIGMQLQRLNLACRSADASKSTAASIEPSTLYKSAPGTTDPPPPPATIPPIDNSMK